MAEENYYHGNVGEYAVIFNSEGNLLLLRYQGEHEAMNGKWHLPGGRFDADDEAGKAILREIEEETGLKNVEIIIPCSVSRWGLFNSKRYNVAYIAQVAGTPDVYLDPNECHDKAEWVTPAEAMTRTYTFPEKRAMVETCIAWAKKLEVI